MGGRTREGRCRLRASPARGALGLRASRESSGRICCANCSAAKEFRARAAAVRVLQHWSDRVTDATALMEKAANDPSPRVRLEAVRSLSYIPTAEATDAALDVLKHTTDYYIQYALDSTITTLEKAWKPALTKGRAISADHPEGLAYLLARLSPVELTALPRSEPVYHELLSRPGVEARYRAEALEGLSRASGRPVLTELLAAIARIDGAAGSAATSKDLVTILIDALGRRGQTPGTEGSDPFVTNSLQRLAMSGLDPSVRQGAWAALVKADGLDRAWQLASRSAPSSHRPHRWRRSRRRRGLEAGAVSARVVDAERAVGNATPVQVTGRYVRILLPGRERTLGLAEVEVLSGGVNIAPKGTATQSSSIPGGDFGGVGGRSPRRQHRRLAGRQGGVLHDARARSVVGARSRRGACHRHARRPPIPRGGRGQPGRAARRRPERRTRRSSRRPTGFPPTTQSTRVRLGGDLTPALRQVAIAALPSIPGHDEQTVTLLTALAPRRPGPGHGH